jgi:hypothetical protein
MKNLAFKIHREPCVPNPCYRDARTAKEKISSLGGRFYRFFINGCATTAELVRHLMEEHGLSESAVNDALEAMAETTFPELNEKVRELWGIVECIGGFESTSFAGYAFTGKELDSKTKLFIAGVHKMKKHLESVMNMVADDIPLKATWDI